MGKTSGNNPIRQRMVRIPQAASYLSMSSWKVRQLIATGVLPFLQPEPGSPILLDLADLDRYVETNKHTIT
jgi:excisionase family DNA binding protein